MENLDFNKIWQNFVDQLTNHYADFSGRVGRTQFWWYIAVAVVVSIVAAIIGDITLHVISTLVSLGLLLPNMGMTARRLQDTGRPGNWVFILVIPFLLTIILGFLAVVTGPFGMFFFLFGLAPLISLLALVAAVAIIYLCIQPGQPDANQYGPVPPDWKPGN